MLSASATARPSSALVGFSLQDDEPAFFLLQPSFEQQGSADRKWLPVSNFASRRVGANTLQEKPVRHDVIENAEDDAAVRDAVVALMRGLRRKLRAADIAIEPESDFQANRVRGSAYETTIRIRASS